MAAGAATLWGVAEYFDRERLLGDDPHEKLVKRGFQVDLVFWDHAAAELKKCCSRFVSLNPQLRHLAI